MRKLFVLATTALLSVGVAVTTANATTLNWEGTSILDLGDFPPTPIGGAGVATINGSGGGTHVNSLRLAASRGNVGGDFTQIVTDPRTLENLITLIQFIDIAGGTGTLSPISGGVQSTTNTFNGVLPVRGLVRLCLIDLSCASAASIVLTGPTGTTVMTGTLNGGTTTTFIPGPQVKGIGIGGLLKVTVGGAFTISINAQPWQVKTTTLIDQIETPINGVLIFTNQTFHGWAHDPGSGTTSTAAPSGVVQLVSPTQVATNLPTGSSEKVAAGQTLIIHFVPEPGLLLLIGSGVAGLALLGRKRMRK